MEMFYLCPKEIGQVCIRCNGKPVMHLPLNLEREAQEFCDKANAEVDWLVADLDYFGS